MKESYAQHVIMDALRSIPEEKRASVINDCVTRLRVFPEGGIEKAEEIIAAVAAHFSLKPEHLKSSSRLQHIARPRVIAYAIVRHCLPLLSLPTIGRIFGGRDHTTILTGVRKVQDDAKNGGRRYGAAYHALLVKLEAGGMGA